MNTSSDLLDLNSKTPAFSIVIEGKNVTQVLDKRLMNLTLTDNRGFEAVQLDLELDNADGPIVLPRRGVASFPLQLAEGRADLYTEMPVKVSGFKQPIDEAEWTITSGQR